MNAGRHGELEYPTCCGGFLFGLEMMVVDYVLL